MNKAAQSIIDVASSSKTKDPLISSLSKDKGDSIMLFFCSATKSLKVIHSIMNIGNTSWFTENLVVALDGFNRDRASPVLLDIDSLLVEKEIEVPCLTRLTAITLIEEFEATISATRNPAKFKTYPFILVPPFLWETTISSITKKPADFFIDILICIDDFVDANKEDSDLNSISRSACGNLLRFIWSIAKEELQSINLIPSGDNEQINSWSTQRHENCIESTAVHPVDKDLSRISEVIESSQVALSESLTSSETSEKKGFKKLDDSVKNLILNASAPSSEVAAGAPSTLCENFYKQSSHGSARLTFIRALRHEFSAQVEVSPGVITSIFNGGFTWSHEDSPSNFSVFSFPEKRIFAKNVMTDCIVLQLKELAGKGLSNDDVKEALKQGIEIPQSIESMKYSFLNTVSASKFFFGENSLLTRALIEVYNHIVKNRTIYKSIQHQDQFFISQFMFAIDTKINLWLESCEESKTRKEVDDILLDFSDELQKVRTRNFTHLLPPSIREVSSSLSKDSDESQAENSVSKKRKKEDTSKILNEKKIDKWIQNDEIYSKCLRSGQALNDRPKINGVPACHRFHSRGYCFKNCNNGDSHIFSSDLKVSDRKNYKKWLLEATKSS